MNIAMLNPIFVIGSVLWLLVKPLVKASIGLAVVYRIVK